MNAGVDLKKSGINIAGIMQTLIAGAITGLIVMYANQQTTGVEIAALRSDVDKIRHRQENLVRDFYIPAFRKANARVRVRTIKNA